MRIPYFIFFPVVAKSFHSDFPGGSDGKESACSAGDLGSIPGLGRSSGEGNTPVVLPGEFHGQRNQVGYSRWGQKELDVTEILTLALACVWNECG